MGRVEKRTALPVTTTSTRRRDRVVDKYRGKLMLNGIRFVIDEHGDKTAVQIDLKEHGDLWEDFYDTLLAQTRAAEPRESLEDVRRRLTEQGKLRE
jgi:hypothetical protein